MPSDGPDARGASPVADGPVSLAVVNARVWTGDVRRPWADAIAVRGERLAAVGSSAEVRKLAGTAARVVDARGAFVAPGFIDSHVHFLDGGFRLASVQLRDARTPQAFIQRIAEFARNRASAGEWILGGDWDHEQWGGELPTRAWIDAVTPEHPVWVSRLDGHMALANSLALRLAGVTRATEAPPDGQIVRDASGEPTGILKDGAMALVQRAVPAPSAAAQDAALDAAMRHVNAQGVTAVHHMAFTWDDLAVFERARDAGRLTTRIRTAVPIADYARLREMVAERGTGDAWLSIGALKGFVDGSLGSHTAAFLAPYADAPGDTGLLVHEPEQLLALVREGDAAGLQLVLHAIGDRAVRLTLDVFEHVRAAHGARERRWRIEHAQHVARADLPRFGALGVIASVQPYHAVDDGQWAERVIGAERLPEAFAFRSLRDAGARLAFGSDWFVAPPMPILGIHAAVTRQTLDGRHPDGWQPQERLTVEDALAAYTRDAAYAGFAEAEVGMLRRGMLADFVLVDRDLTRTAPEALREARVLLTTVAGRVVYADPALED